MRTANRRAGTFAVALAAIAALLATPVGAQAMSRAEKLRRLDIMLMVTGLRCRTTPDNFQPDYHRFAARHLTDLNAANDALRREMAARGGAAGADRALDRLSVTMANSYGQGHPRLDCKALRLATRNLAEARGAAVLEAAADQLLDHDIPVQVAARQRR